MVTEEEKHPKGKKEEKDPRVTGASWLLVGPVDGLLKTIGVAGNGMMTAGRGPERVVKFPGPMMQARTGTGTSHPPR